MKKCVLFNIDNFHTSIFMKVTTLILAVACAVGFSSCCCQSQSAPILHPMPKNCTAPADAATGDVATQPTEPVKVFDQKGK